MARVTVEDCLRNVKNRFELVMIAAKRARQLMRGKEPRVEWDNDKATVVALREIAEGHTNFDQPESTHDQELHAIHQHLTEATHNHLKVIEANKEKEKAEDDDFALDVSEEETVPEAEAAPTQEATEPTQPKDEE